MARVLNRMQWPFLSCGGCHKRILLPVPNQEKTSTDQPQWPTGTWTATVLHLGCGHLSAYTARELRSQMLTRTKGPILGDRQHLQAVPQWLRVRLRCVDQYCKARTTIFVCLSSPLATEKIISTIFDEPTVWPKVSRC